MHTMSKRRVVATIGIRRIVGAAVIVLVAAIAPSAAFAESLTVSNTATTPIQTSFATEQGAIYEISASGVVSDWDGHQDGVDAVWCYGEWRCPQPQAWNQLRIDDQGMSDIAGHEIPYNGGHSYSVEFTGDGAPIKFYMADAIGSAGDNSGAIQVTVTKLRDAPSGNGGNNNGNGGNTGQEQTPQLEASIVCNPNPLVITISELPSRTCTIWIGGWRHDTESPVQVLLPAATDDYGNHANGIQVWGGQRPGWTQGGVAPSNMGGYRAPDGNYGEWYPWNLLVFACPGEPGTGASCYNSATSPGDFTVPIIVHQDGAADANILLTGRAVASPPPGGGGTAAPTPAQTSTADVHRWFNPSTGHHFYTTDPQGELAPSAGYRSEGVGFRLWSSQVAGSTLLYRWYNPQNGDHFYTTDPSGELAPRLGYRQETPLGWVFRQQASGTVALYRWYNPQSGDHFYTTDASGELATRAGYRPEGAAGYVLPAE